MISDKKTPTVLALSGSLRSPSFTEKMLDTLLEGTGEMEVHKFYPSQNEDWTLHKLLELLAGKKQR